MFCLILLILFYLHITFSFIIALVFSHTLNMLFNGHFFALGRYFGITKVHCSGYFEYIDKMKSRLKKKKCMRFVLIYGSLSRKQISETSDLDVRVLPNNNLNAIMLCCFWVFLERSIGLLNRFPVDIYVESKPAGLNRMRSDEVPIVLLSNESPEKYFSKFKSYEEIVSNQ